MDFSIKNICYFKPLLAITLVSVVNSCAFALSDDSLNNTTTQNPSDNIVVYDKAYTLNKTDSVQNNTIIIPSYDKENNKLTEQKYVSYSYLLFVTAQELQEKFYLESQKRIIEASLEKFDEDIMKKLRGYDVYIDIKTLDYISFFDKYKSKVIYDR